jgi:hypothetical protein
MAYVTTFGGAYPINLRSDKTRMRVVAVNIPPSLPQGGAGYLAGEAPDGLAQAGGIPAEAEIRVHFRNPGRALDGTLVKTTRAAADGTWRVEGLNPDSRYDVIGRLEDYNDVIVSNVAPER